MEILKISHIEKYFGHQASLTKALDDISFTVKKGEFIAIMGPSGSGKSTLLNCISTIDTPTGGEVKLEGESISIISDKEMAKFRRENLGFVFQDYNLIDTLKIKENIGLPLIMNGVNPITINIKVEDISSVLGISNILEKYPYEVSGGERQRAACSRAIINNPKLLLADEPTGALDSSSSKILMETFRNINKKMNVTILMVTHDGFAASYSDRVIFLKDGKIHTEIYRGGMNRKSYYEKIFDITISMGESYD